MEEGESTSTEAVKECAVAEEGGDELEDRGLARSKRECPVPKPGGLVGEILGFNGSSSDGKGSRPP
jgi:cytochrome c oxidase assembly factor 2